MAVIDIKEEEWQLIRKYILIPIVLDSLERDIKEMKKNDKYKMADVYLRKMRQSQNMATKEKANVKRELTKRGIKVFEEKRTVKMLESKFLCRGYRHELNMLWNIVKAEVKIIIAGYMDVSLTDDTIEP